MEQSFLHAHCPTVSLTSFRTHESGDCRTTTLPSDRPVRSHRALPECRYRPNWLPPTPPESPDYFRPPPAGYSRTALFLRIHSQSRVYKYVRAFTVPLFYTSGLSPYCCYIPNRTIHNQGSTWTSLTIHRTQFPQHLNIDSHNTLYLLYKSSMCLSQDRSNN